MRAVFDDHLSAAVFTYDIGLLILDLNMGKFFFCFLYCRIQIRIEVLYYCLPLYIAFFNSVKHAFHVGGKFRINYCRELICHYTIDYFTEFRNKQIFIFLQHITSCQYGRNGRCISRRSSYTRFLKSPYKTCFSIMCGRLGEMLFLFKRLKFDRTVLVYLVYKKGILGFAVVIVSLFIRIDFHKAFTLQR